MRGRATALRLHSLGDLVLAQPAVAHLQSGGDAALVTDRPLAPVALRFPGELEVLPLPPGAGPIALRALIRESGGRSVYDLQGNLTTRLATLGMDVAARYSPDRAARRRVLRGGGGPMPLRWRELAELAGAAEPAPPRLEREGGPPPGAPVVGIVVGGRWRMKSIPPGVAAECARLLLDSGSRVVVMGGPADAEEVEATSDAVHRPGVERWAGGEGTMPLVRRLERLSALVSPDSGPAHVARALGVPVTVVFTSTSPELGFWGPGTSSARAEGVSCRPCHRHGGDSCSRGREDCRNRLVPLLIVEEVTAAL